MGERILTVGGNKASRPIEDLLGYPKPMEWFVGPNAKDDGDDGRSGKSKETSVATLDHAIDLAVANTDSQNDIIHVLPGHAETVSSAGMINLDKIGLRVICHGTGALRPTFTFSATDATILMSAASTSIEGFPLLIPSIDSVVSGIVVSAANCKIEAEVRDANDIEFVTAILTTAGADNLDINLKYIGDIGGDACVAPIQLVGVDTARIYVDFYGVADTAVVNFITTNSLNIDIEGKFTNVGTALTKNVVDTKGTCTWSVRGWDGVANANFTGGDNKTLAYADLETIASDLVVLDGIVDGEVTKTATIASDLVVLDGIVDGEVTKTATIASDLVVMDALIDSILSDTTLFATNVASIVSAASDMTISASDVASAASDIALSAADIATIKSDLIVTNAIVDKISSDLIVADGIADDIKSDLIVLDAIVDGEVTKTTTIASDLVVMDALIDTVKSDLIVTQSDVKVSLSGLAIIESDLKSFWSAWQTFETLMSDFVVKYESDNP